jgi:hypothetical protein
MKTEASYEDKRYIYNPKPEILDDFWNDCVELKEKKQNNITKNSQQSKSNNMNNNNYQHQHIQYNPSKGRNENNNLNKKSNIRAYHSVKLFNPKNKINNNMNSSLDNNNNNNHYNNNKLSPLTEKFLSHLYIKYPSFIEEKREKEDKKIKSKNALMRCLGLYAYGLELQKSMKLSKENNEKLKEKEDISKCTFKPKLNKKISYLDDNINFRGNNNKRLYQNNLKKYVNKSVDNYHNKKSQKNIESEEYTFKPEIFTNPKLLKRMFRNSNKNNKSIYEENAEFILRYTKARDEYLIRRFKKMYRKDDNYDYSLLSLTKRLCNKQYRNYLNVNNKILLSGETISPNEYIHSSIADFKGVSFCNETAPNQKKANTENYIVGLRKNLHSLDLNETEEP